MMRCGICGTEIPAGTITVCTSCESEIEQWQAGAAPLDDEVRDRLEEFVWRNGS